MTVKHALPKKVTRDINVGVDLIRIWHVNLGSERSPVWYTFIGVYNSWMWVPIVWTANGPGFDLTVAAKDGGGITDWVEVQEAK